MKKGRSFISFDINKYYISNPFMFRSIDDATWENVAYEDFYFIRLFFWSFYLLKIDII